jgi:hypothetical protein
MEGEVRVNPAASGYPDRDLGRGLPPGAIVAELHYPSGHAEPDSIFAMTKRPPGYDPGGGDWEYLILTPAGRVAERGRLPLCKRCHAEAPYDHLFGGPR